jgi:hypothetical protein
MSEPTLEALNTKLAESWDSRWFRELLELLEAAHDRDGAAYRSEWIPRLREVPELWEEHRIPISTDFDSARAARYLELAPQALFRVELYRGAELAALDAFDFIEHIGGLTFSDWREGFIDFAWLGELPLTGLRSLNLLNYGMNAAQAAALFEMPEFYELSTLSLGGNPIGDEGAIALSECAALSNLRELNLDTCEIGDEGVDFLCSSDFIEELLALDLSYNRFGKKGAIALSTSCFAPTLQKLSVSGLAAEHIALIRESTRLSQKVRDRVM